MMNFFDDYKGRADTFPLTATARGAQPASTPCKFAIVANFNVVDEESFAYDASNTNIEGDGGEVYIGFNGTVSMQVMAGSQSTKLFINNLDQLIIKSRPGMTRRVWITYFY